MSIAFGAARRFGAFSYDAELMAKDEILVLFGHSGAGKSLTLQLAAGLLRPATGRIVIDGRIVFDSERGIDLPPQQRGVGYVVQELALFRHMTVEQNIAFGIPAGIDRHARAGALLDLLGLAGMGARRPDSLSGGQRQRVALARALARDARLLLLDEPFSALDESLRADLRRELVRLRNELGLTILFVTHDLREAHLLADRIAVFDDGRILQCDERETVFRRPADRRVAELTGVSNVFRGAVLGTEGGAVAVEVAGARFRCMPPPGIGALPAGTAVDLAIRAERVNLRRVSHEEGAMDNRFEAVVYEEFSYGSTHTLRLKPVTIGPAVESELAARPYEVLGVASQKRWTVELPAEDLHLMRIAS